MIMTTSDVMSVEEKYRRIFLPEFRMGKHQLSWKTDNFFKNSVYFDAIPTRSDICLMDVSLSTMDVFQLFSFRWRRDRKIILPFFEYPNCKYNSFKEARQKAQNAYLWYLSGVSMEVLMDCFLEGKFW